MDTANYGRHHGRVWIIPPLILSEISISLALAAMGKRELFIVNCEQCSSAGPIAKVTLLAEMIHHQFPANQPEVIVATPH